MTDFLIRLDTSVFYFCNRTLQNPVFDVVMPFLTDLNRQKVILVAVLLALLLMILYGERNVRLAAVLFILTIFLSDQLSSSVIKFLVERERPCRELLNVHLLVGCGSGYSFPSSHAVNNAAGAILLSYFIPRGAPWFFGLATLVCFSRVYVGVHYPSDVLGGAVIGAVCALAVIGVFESYERVTRHRGLSHPPR